MQRPLARVIILIFKSKSSLRFNPSALPIFQFLDFSIVAVLLTDEGAVDCNVIDKYGYPSKQTFSESIFRAFMKWFGARLQSAGKFSSLSHAGIEAHPL